MTIPESNKNLAIDPLNRFELAGESMVFYNKQNLKIYIVIESDSLRNIFYSERPLAINIIVKGLPKRGNEKSLPVRYVDLKFNRSFMIKKILL
jgi:hypothetical protein